MQMLLASCLALGCLVTAHAEPRGALVPPVDAMTQSRVPSQDAQGKAENKVAQKSPAPCCASGSRNCPAKCTSPCVKPPARNGYFGSLFGLLDSRPSCPRRDIAGNDEEDTAPLPSPDRPPRLI
ncbi:hypothetical protein FNU76_04980 [Chitinimonas arctica]|uniref:CopL family metal-binding regulatory protein n=1 Tax=Chitinimonas arctica TaxID=2594795 RepID=A0A516SC82_9NEIS|nr:hypothetical protein [Chitinimonas arctica]QDQ25753.1 hypothetical protein FNU76_04980 [Chitinimonas arctica]